MNKFKEISIIAVFILAIFYIGNFSGKVVATAYPVYKLIQENAIIQGINSYKEVSTKHFNIKYTEEDAKYVDLVSKVAEQSYKSVGADLGYYPKRKSTIIVFPTKNDMEKSMSLSKGDDAMGVYINGVIGILSPNLWINDKDNFNYIFKHEGPVLHEYTHLIVDDIAKGNYPIWFTEGIALNEEYRINGYRWGEGYNFKGRPYSINELTNNFNTLDEILAYKRSFNIVDYISNKFGNKKVLEILKDLGSGMTMNDAFIKALNKTTNEIDSASILGGN